ncbi:MAG: pilin [Patescibacteria group bacterium]|nr:pilin [Patescibacteria group bacterium]
MKSLRIFIFFLAFLFASSSLSFVQARYDGTIEIPVVSEGSFSLSHSVHESSEDLNQFINVGEVFALRIFVVNGLRHGASLILKTTLNQELKPYKAGFYPNPAQLVSTIETGSGSCEIDNQDVSCGISLNRNSIAIIQIEAYANSSGAFRNSIFLYDVNNSLRDQILESSVIVNVADGPAFSPPPSPRIDSLCSDDASVYTAVGCVPMFIQGTVGTVNFFLVLFGGIAGMVTVFLIIYGGFLIMTSIGNPTKLQSGKELITSAIYGLFLLLFSIFILRLISSDLLFVF